MDRLDRTAFRAVSFHEADNNAAYWLRQSVADRLRAAALLTRQAYGLPQLKTLSLDRDVARVRIRAMSNNIFNPDFADFVKALNRSGVRYMLVGGYAVIIHGYNRSTGDLDLWVEPTQANYRAVQTAFADFGMPLFDMTEDKFLRTADYDVFSFGVPPVAIDLITHLKGLNFGDAYSRSSVYEFEDFAIRVIQYQDLLKAKQAAGRHRDLNDIEQLEKGRKAD